MSVRGKGWKVLNYQNGKVRRGKSERRDKWRCGKNKGAEAGQPAPMCLPACGQASLGHQRIPREGRDLRLRGP